MPKAHSLPVKTVRSRSSRVANLPTRAIAAAAILIEESQKLTLQGKVRVHTPHDLKMVLSQRRQHWLMDSRILRYEIILKDMGNLELVTSKSLNPAQFLSGESLPELEHDCLELVNLQTKGLDPYHQN